MTFYSYNHDGRKVHVVKGTDLELAFYAANYPNLIIFEHDEDLRVPETFYGPSHWETVNLRGFHNNPTLHICPRCGATVPSNAKRLHILWHFANFGESRAVPSKGTNRGYIKGAF